MLNKTKNQWLIITQFAIFQLSTTAGPRDTRFWGNEKTHAAQGYQYVIQCSKQKKRKYLHTLKMSFKLINCGLSYLQPKMWSEAIFRIYSSLDHFIVDSLQTCLLEAAIDRLNIQLGTISPFNQHWISRKSVAASKMHFLRLSMIKWSKPV